MKTDEIAERRTRLRDRARSTLGDEEATTLMESLPWTVEELATKRDLLDLRTDLKADIARLETKLERSMRIVVLEVVVANATMIGGAAALAQHLR